MKLFITPDGDTEAVYDDAIPKRKLGVATMRRESQVEFDNVLQVWQAIDDLGEVMCSDPDRNKCLAKEKAIVESSIEHRMRNLF